MQLNMKSFWSFINSKRKNNTAPSSVYLNGLEASGGANIASTFARHFKSFYTSSSPDLPPIKPDPPISLQSMKVTREELMQAIMVMNKNAGPGHDQIPALFISNCCANLIDPLLSIFNLSLETGVFSERWKPCYIRPTHKSGNINNVENYRPITTTCAMAKLLDYLVTIKMLDKVKCVIILEQHGFVHARSTVSNLVTLTHLISDSISSHIQVDAFYSDFSRAFDSVNHDLLLRKLNNIGISGSILK